MEISIHNVSNIIVDTATEQLDKTKSYVRKMHIMNTDGELLQLTLFSDNSQNLQLENKTRNERQDFIMDFKRNLRNTIIKE